MKRKTSLPVSYRLAVTSRVLAAVVGGYLLASLGQASRIPGVTPAAISLLMIHLKKRGAGRQLEQSA